MPKRATAPTGAPCWVQLNSSDTARSRDFYSRLFGWVASEPVAELGGYFTFTKDGVPVAGGMGTQPGHSDGWTLSLATGDAEKTVALAAERGAEITVAPMAVADLGTMLELVDPAGAVIGGWQPDQFHGTGVLAEPGTPGWFELHTRGYDEAVRFYREVFGWDVQVMSDEPDFRYTVQRHGEEQLAGIMDASAFLPEGTPSHWSVYFSVADADATVEQVVALGGSVVAAAESTPYGRLATVADPTGAVFRLQAG